MLNDASPQRQEEYAAFFLLVFRSPRVASCDLQIQERGIKVACCDLQISDRGELRTRILMAETVRTQRYKNPFGSSPCVVVLTLQPSDEAFTLLLPSVVFINTQGSKDVKMVDQKELLAALEVQHKRDNRPGITKEAVAEIKSSAIFQVNWEDLLKSAPISINALGAALVASSSETATTIEFTPPKGGFKFLQ
jgi:hypothetical protein